MVLARGVHASFALITSLGYAIYPKAKARLYALPIWATALALWSVSRIRPFRLLLATGRDECCALVDAMVSFAPPGPASSVVAAIEAMKPI
jgi:2-dehydropantoate 2-reductase